MSEFTAELAAVLSQAGPGVLLRVVIIVCVVGVALLAWFLLRGYGGHDR